MDVFCRRELKFLVTVQQRAALEQLLSKKMIPDAYPHSSIRNIYYDTPDFRLIRHSLLKPVYKEKLRLRCYGESQEVFLEMKKKFKEKNNFFISNKSIVSTYSSRNIRKTLK